MTRLIGPRVAYALKLLFVDDVRDTCSGRLHVFTHNPMYLGVSLVLVGFCAYLANPLSVLAVVVFVGYITRFQMIPEERVLLAKFGEPYAQYARSVRRLI